MSTHNLYTELDTAAASALHRIGSVARVAGVPVSTLRMWEGRHGAFTPRKTEGKHRLYTGEDVVRARLLRQLTEAGHSIGGIARLAAPQLQEMLVQVRSADGRQPRDLAPRRLSMIVVSAGLAARVTSEKWQRLLGGDVLDVRRIFHSLEDAVEAAPRAGDAADVLLVRISALQPPAGAQLTQAMERLGTRHCVVLYNFAAEPVVNGLREQGLLLRREPIEDRELAELLRSVTWAGAPAPAAANEARAAAIPPRRYSDEDLARIALSPQNMLCECPRHIAEIIGQLASFEDYSARCLNLSEEDAQVHAYLRSVSGSARALFEDAMQRVVAHNESLRG